MTCQADSRENTLISRLPISPYSRPRPTSPFNAPYTLAMMEYHNTRRIDLLSVKASRHPSNFSSQSVSTPHYVIPTQEIAADRDSPLGANRRTGCVFKGFWNNSVVAVKVLAVDTPIDVSWPVALTHYF